MKEELARSDLNLATDMRPKRTTGIPDDMRSLQKAIEDNNAVLFMQLRFTKEEVLALRFQHSMNLLQAACYYSSEGLVRYCRDLFHKDDIGMSELTDYQEPFGGNMAIHFAVLKGNKKILDMLLNDFKASP